MKYLFTILTSLSLCGGAFAKEPVCETSDVKVINEEKRDINTKVPKRLKGAVIIVREADGKETIMPIEKYKVVPRKQQFITTKVDTLMLHMCKVENSSKNRVSVLGGYGAKNGLETSQSGNTVTVETKSGANVGAQYQRMLNDDWSVGAQVQSNKTTSLMLGLDF